MKNKKTMLCMIVLLFTFLIYKVAEDKKIYYISIGDYLSLGIEQNGVLKNGYNNSVVKFLNQSNSLEFYTNDFSKSDMRIVDMIKMIENNETINVDAKNTTIKNALVKTDLLTVSVGMNDVLYKIETEDESVIYKYLNEIIEDYDKLFNLLRRYCKEDIVLIGVYNFSLEYEEYFDYLILRLSNLADFYNIYYIDTDLILTNAKKENNKYLSSDNYNNISDAIIEYMENEILHKK